MEKLVSWSCLMSLLGLILILKASGIEGLVCHTCDPCVEATPRSGNETCELPAPIPDTGKMACVYEIANDGEAVRRRCKFLRKTPDVELPTGTTCQVAVSNSEKKDCFCFTDLCNDNLPQGEAPAKKPSTVEKCPEEEKGSGSGSGSESGSKLKGSFVLILAFVGSLMIQF